MVSRRFALAALALAGVTIAVHARSQAPGRSTAPPAGVERHLAHNRRLTSGGENAGAYFSPYREQLSFQSNPGRASPTPCDQMVSLNTGGSNKHRVSNGGR